MYTDVMDHPCELIIYGKLFFTLVAKTVHVRLDSLTMKNHHNAGVVFFFVCVVNLVPQNPQKIESANGGKTRM